MRFLFYIVGLLALGACSNKISEAMQGEGTELLPVQTTYDAVITYSNDGVITSKLYSKQIDHYSTKDTSYILMNKGFRAVFFDSLGHQTSELTAVKGVYYENAKIMIGEKKVVFKNGKDEHLYTDKLTWYQDSSSIATESPVKIVRKDGIIYGKGLEAAEDFSSYNIHHITGELYVEETDSTFSAKDSLP